MPDHQRRRLERGVDLDDAARLLIEQRRLGELSEAQLSLAAYLGHPPAVLAFEGRRVEDEEALIDTSTAYGALIQSGRLRQRKPALKQLLFFRGLLLWGYEAARRVLVAHQKSTTTSPFMVSYWGKVSTWMTDPSATNEQHIEDHLSAFPGPSGLLRRSFPLLRPLPDDGPQTWYSRRYFLSDLETILARNLRRFAWSGLRAEIHDWLFSERGRSHLKTPSLVPQPEGPSYRQQVIEAVTSPERIRIVEVLAKSFAPRTRWVELTYRSGETRKVEVLSNLGLESFVGFVRGGQAAGYISLDNAVGARILEE